MGVAIEDLFVQEIETYDKNLDAFLGEGNEQRRGWVLIKDHDIVGIYDTERDAIAEGYRHFGNVAFFVKQVTPTIEPANYLSQVSTR
ncbi:MAG TPA: hypothetical protein VH063_06560 [Gaiellaceae bacterium]|nr:hypothetical protein [Gaiellaceae bacterium]